MWTLPQSGKHWSRQKKKRNGWQTDGRMRTHMPLPLYDRRPGAGESLALCLNRRRSVSLAGMTAELFHRWAGWVCVLTCLPPLLTGQILLQLNTPVANTKKNQAQRWFICIIHLKKWSLLGISDLHYIISSLFSSKASKSRLQMSRGKDYVSLLKKKRKKRHIALGAECRSSAEKCLTHKTSLHTLK